MLRLKVELETCYAEDRMDVLKKAHAERLEEVNELKEHFAFKEQVLLDEIKTTKSKLNDRDRRLKEANEKADNQILQIRMILDKSERTHQREFQTEIANSERLIRAYSIDHHLINKSIIIDCHIKSL